MKKVTALFMVLVLLLGLAGCQKSLKKGIVGTWSWENAGDYQLTFNADGSAYYSNGDEWVEGATYSINGTTLTLEFTDDGYTDEWQNVRIEGDNLHWYCTECAEEEAMVRVK